MAQIPPLSPAKNSSSPFSFVHQANNSDEVYSIFSDHKDQKIEMIRSH